MAARGKAAAAAGRGEVLVHVEEDGARDVPGPLGVTPVPGRIQVEPHVDDAQRLERDAPAAPISRASQPVATSASMPARPYFICVIGFGTFL